MTPDFQSQFDKDHMHDKAYFLQDISNLVNDDVSITQTDSRQAQYSAFAISQI